MSWLNKTRAKLYGVPTLTLDPYLSAIHSSLSYSITGYGDDDGRPMHTQFREMKTLMRRAFLSFLRENDTTPLGKPP